MAESWCNMCKFCSNKPEAIILSTKQSGVMGEKIKICEAKIQDNGLVLEMVFDNLPSNLRLSVLKKKIFYCPMCGRELVKE